MSTLKAYYFWGSLQHKSKIYNMATDQFLDTKINFKIPAKDFFDDLYKSILCPLSHKKENVIPFVYGKSSKKLIKLAEKGQVKFAGFIL